MTLAKLLAQDAAVKLLGENSDALSELRKLVEVAYLSGFNAAADLNYLHQLRAEEENEDTEI